MHNMPGGDLIQKGLYDLENADLTAEALLVLIGSPKLQLLGITIPSFTVDHPEHRLYELLAQTYQDAAHSKYNALVRKLVSFERALACANQ